MKKINNSTKIAFVAYALFLFIEIFNRLNGFGFLLSLCDYLAIALLVISVLLNIRKGIKISRSIPYVIFLLISLIVSLLASNIIKLPLLLLVFSITDLDKDKFKLFIKTDLITRTIMILLLILLYYIGFSDGYIPELRNGVMRNSFGVGHPNIFAGYIFMIGLEIWFLAQTKKQKLLAFVSSILLFVFVHYCVGSRTSEYLICISAVMMPFKEGVFTLCKKIRILPWSFILFGILSLVLAFWFNENNQISVNIDNAVSKRLSYSHELITDSDRIKLIGKELTKDDIVLDNAYLNVIVRYGLIMFVILAFLFFLLCRYAINNRLPNLTVALIILLIFGMLEASIISPTRNPFLLAIALPIFEGFYQRKKKAE